MMNPNGVTSVRATIPELIPYVPLVDFHAILLAESPEFILEGFLLMMLVLIFDVFCQPWYVDRTDGEGSVSALPLKIAAARFRFQPRRRSSFLISNEIGDGDLATQTAKQVDVIFEAADNQRRRIQIPAHLGQVSMGLGQQSGVLQKGLTKFGRVNDVEINLCE